MSAASSPQRVAIVGAGLIGRAWAIVFARAGNAVALTDAAPGAMQGALEWIDRTLDEMRAHGLIAEPPQAVRLRISAAGSLADALDGAAYVQENVRETVEAKREIFAEMDRLAAPDCVLASSTSFIPASAFSVALAGRARQASILTFVGCRSGCYRRPARRRSPRRGPRPTRRPPGRSTR